MAVGWSWLCLVRIDGERTTGHWRQVYDVGPFGDSQVLAIFVDRAHRRGSYTYGLNRMIDFF